MRCIDHVDGENYIKLLLDNLLQFELIKTYVYLF